MYKLATSIQSRGVRNFRFHVFPNLFIHRGVIYLEEISNQIHYRTRLSRVFEIYYRLFSRKILSRFKKEEKKADIFHERSCHLRANNKRLHGRNLFFFSSLLDTNVISKSFFMHYRWLDDRLSFQRARLCFKSFRWREETKPGPLESVRADLLKRARL